jgi:hypothetical protein
VSGRRYRSGDWFRTMIDPPPPNPSGLASACSAHTQRLTRLTGKNSTGLGPRRSAPELLAGCAIAPRARKGGTAKTGAALAAPLAVRTARSGCRWAGSHQKHTRAAIGILQSKFKD